MATKRKADVSVPAEESDQLLPKEEKVDLEVFQKRAQIMFQDMFGKECVDHKDGSSLSITVDGKTAYINLETRTVEYEDSGADDESLREMLELAVTRLYDAMSPLM